MDQLTYPALIKQILTQHIDLCNQHSRSELESFLIEDAANGHYLWMTVGWQQGNRVVGATVYVRIKDGKFWIEEDWTEVGIANELVTAGVPKTDIVLAFHDPTVRQQTEFAVA